MATKTKKQSKFDKQRAAILKDRMDACLPSLARLTKLCRKRLGDSARMDEQLAPIWAEKLRHSYAKVFEIKYPELMAANGDVLPIDSSVDPASLEWEYFSIDQTGYADWIDDEGEVMASGSIKVKRHKGVCHEIGHKFTLNWFDLERAQAAGPPNLPLLQLKQKNAKRVHDATTNWVWLFGDSAKQIPGLANNPHITVSLAPLNAGASSRAWADKTNDEIALDVATLINTIATDTLGMYHAAVVFMSRSMYHTLRDRRLGAGDGYASLLGLLKDRYSGDESGQGKVEFKIMNECQASLRRNPRPPQTDTSGLPGDFILAIPAADKEELCFIRARAYTQKPPQEQDFKVKHLTHSKIGGVKLQIPLAVHRMDFAVGS